MSPLFAATFIVIVKLVGCNSSSNISSNSFWHAVELVNAAYSPKDLAIVQVDSLDIDRELHDFLETVRINRANRVLQTFSGNQSSVLKDVEQNEVVLAKLSEDPEANEMMAYTLKKRMGFKVLATPRLVIFVSLENSLQNETSLMDHITRDCYANIRFSVILETESGADLYAFKYGKLEKLCDLLSLEQCNGGPVRGNTIRVTYDNWNPMFYRRPDGSFAGMMHDLFDIIATRLNLTIIYVDNVDPGIWGVPKENGSWDGMMGMLFREEVDISVAGFATTSDRYQAVDFSHDVIAFKVTLFAQRSAGSKVNVQTYFYEFDRFIWFGILLTSLLCIFIIFVILALTSADYDSKGGFAVSVVLRALASKGTAMIAKPSLALKMTVLVFFLFSTVLFVSYRGCLNAFLAVVNEPEGIQTLDDVLEQTQGISFWPSGLVESTFANADSSSTMGKLYQQFSTDPKAPIYSYSDGLLRVSEENYALLAEDDTTAALPEFTCEIVWVKDFLFFKHANAIPIVAGSKFRDPINKELLKLINQGIIERLKRIHIKNRHRNEADCHESRVGSLTYHHVFAPFAGLAFGAITSIVLGMFEFLLSCGDERLPHEVTVVSSRKEMMEKEAALKIMHAKQILSFKNVNGIQQVEALRALLSK